MVDGDVMQRNPHPEVGSFVLKLCLAGAVMSLMRTPLLPITKLGDLLHTSYPDIPPSDTLGKVSIYPRGQQCPAALVDAGCR